MKAATAAALLAAALLWGQAPAHAGRTCEQKLPEAANVQRSLDLAQRTAKALDASGAQVVVLARAGQDLSRWQLRYSHLGYAYRDGATWRVVHKLNTCGSATADLYRQGLGEFFMDDLYRFEAAWVVPTPQAQKQLLPILMDNTRAQTLHAAPYNMVAYPWAQQYQQSNQWALETLALSHEPSARTRERAQAWLKLRGYEPTVLRIGAMTRLGARMGSSHIAFDDHPNEKRFSDRIETVTVDSVFAWMQREGLSGPMQVLR
jgi:hypothetical protein